MKDRKEFTTTLISPVNQMGFILLDSLLGAQAPVLGLGELITRSFFLLSESS